MNKAITDGVLLMPPAFADGLGVWSSGDGTPGSDTYDGAVNAALVPSDADFGGCLELVKTEATQKLRHMGQTPILPGCYLQVKARVKAVSGALPDVRIAAWAGNGSNAHVSGLVEVGPDVSITTYGDIVEVSAIIGGGTRGGVDMVWGDDVVYAHVGLDLTGAIGGVVRIDDLEVIDITSAYLRDMMDWVDVRDFGAVGDGITDDSAAFAAANDAADGREVLVSEGTYFLDADMTFTTPVRFVGTVTMPTDKLFGLTKNFDYQSYFDAFGNERLAFEKAFQSLLNNADHESLDLGGRRITIDGPMDMQAIVPNRTQYAQRRVIRNGQFYVTGDTVWDPEVVNSTATYNASNSKTLSNVTNVANIPVGSLVTGNGVGREIYVRSKNEAAQEVTLSQPLFDAEGVQTYTFTRFKYVMDFSGFDKIQSFEVEGIEFLCNSKASGILLAPSGLLFHVRNCHFTRPAHRGITSHGGGCQGLLVDHCNFNTAEGGTRAQDRQSVAINSNSNDVKLRSNRASQFRHFAVIGGTNATVIGNHFFQGDGETGGVRTAGLLIAVSHPILTFDGNYVDNCSIEWTNEYSAVPSFNGGFSFSSLSVTDSVFLSGDVAPWTGFIVIKPHGSGHYLGGLTVTGNKFRSVHGAVDRVDQVDTTFADLDKTKGKHVLFEGNSFHAITTPVHNPVLIEHDQNSHASTWVVETEGRLPFGWRARAVEAVVMKGKIKNTSNVTEYTMPYVSVEEGSDGSDVHLNWEKSVKGTVWTKIRMD
ncbi:right-handed parallel beta-helix repeat-containing protein [Shimia sp. CNT1-13L.2]|uniref:glycosyl hydrolase family 28-related protein n=1 Tax=Shimia sp. CNT1-13L.2 TaxID=2959663 RepID=UPI0020CC32BF|nr:glycosyl hydrolase family 28-related protein [Shimia sp. CNT1-13L.2]MCP9480385.1 right-handed parallel beta-helix repeat-containing protein [Shimia sp. CNT1-13L.2]